MDLTSLAFLIFLAAALLVYYLVPENRRWMVLLAVSLVFICTYDIRGILFILLSACSIFFAGKKMDAIQADSQTEPALRKAKQKRILQLTLLLNLGILILLKYLLPALIPPRSHTGALVLLIPLGLSYYTLQAISYVMDVYWGRCPAETSFPRVLLYLCYFPQMIQGPISRYQDLGVQLSEKPHPFQVKSLKFGVQLMLWGYFQVMVVSKRMGELVDAIFYGPDTAYGLSVLIGLCAFGVQLYCNFSGGIDIIRGVSECFDIHLAENFRQPFFSRSLGEFWRRWHITLGTWMKDYVFYPFSMSKPVSRMKKSLKKHMSRRMANRIPIVLANVLVFFLVGIWHGTGTNYAIWGLYNGILLALAELLSDPFTKAKTALHISGENPLWKLFCWARTFGIVTLGWVTDCAVTAAGSFLLVKNLFSPELSNLGFVRLNKMDFAILVFGTLAVILVDILHEKGISIREKLNQQNYWVQVLFWALFIQIIACLRSTLVSGGFLYANF